jgi:hypothetical protein
MLEAGKKNPSNHAIIDENKAPKTRRKTRILEKLRSGSTTNDFAGSDKTSAPLQNIKMRNTAHVQQGNKGTLFTRVMIVSGKLSRYATTRSHSRIPLEVRP